MRAIPLFGKVGHLDSVKLTPAKLFLVCVGTLSIVIKISDSCYLYAKSDLIGVYLRCVAKRDDAT
jgi:hypothetical protein